MGSNRSKLKKYNVVDLFCGAGGFSLGLKDTNRFNSILANDIDMDMCEAYSLNFPKTKILSKSISDIDFLSINSKNTIDVVVGGPPCQAYSLSGKRDIDDPRANLFLEYFRAIELIRPQIFVYENVKGLLDPRNRSSLDLILSEFNKAGYKTYYSLLNAYDFGLPQNRDRIFIVGIRKDIATEPFMFPKPFEHENNLSTIIDNEDSVAAVDAEDKVRCYRNWLGLMKGDLTANLEKNGKKFIRKLNPNRNYISKDGKKIELHGRALLLNRNVGHLMTNPGIILKDGQRMISSRYFRQHR